MKQIKIVPAFIHFWTQKKRFKIAQGGRGGAKSIATADLLIDKARTERCIILCTREVQKSIKDSVLSLLSERIHYHDLQSEFTILNTEIKHNTTGSRFAFAGLKDHTVDSIKSFQNVKYCWIEEAQAVTKRSLDVLIPTIRADESEIIMTFNRTEEDDPCHVLFAEQFDNAKIKKWDFNGKILEWKEHIDEESICLFINYDGNPYFPDVLDKERIRCFERSINDYRHIWLGEPMVYSDDALWKIEWITKNRWKGEIPSIVEMVTAVDPAVSNNPDSDETGIITVGKARIQNEWHFFVFSDASCQASASTWAAVVCSEYHEWKADKVIGEVNQGGDLVEQNIRQIDKNLRFKAVRATRGKAVRAEPVSALYEQKRVHHVGKFLKLEHQLCSWSPVESKSSPDRLDALVWGLSYLAGIGQFDSGVTNFVIG